MNIGIDLDFTDRVQLKKGKALPKEDADGPAPCARQGATCSVGYLVVWQPLGDTNLEFERPFELLIRWELGLRVSVTNSDYHGRV